MLIMTLAEIYKSISRARTLIFSARILSSFVRINFNWVTGLSRQTRNTSAILQIKKGESSPVLRINKGVFKTEISNVPKKLKSHVRNAVTSPGINPNENVTAAVKIVSKNKGIINLKTVEILKYWFKAAAITQIKVIFKKCDDGFCSLLFIFNILLSLSKKNLSAYNRGMEAGQYAAGAYFTLIFVLVFFIALTFILIYYLSRELNRSIQRVKESSNFSRAILLAQEDERARLSRDLHDTIAQDLRYLSLEMSKIGKTKDDAERENLCADAASLQSDLIRKLRDICDYLVPPDFRFQGLPDALRRLCLDFGKRTGIDCRIDITGEIPRNFLNEEKHLQIFRIVQEALNNVEKHACAAEAIVILRCDPESGISVGISDDGKGFKVNIENNLSMGIRGMNERAAFLGGSLEIKSEPEEGTLVCLQIPVKGNFNECNVN